MLKRKVQLVVNEDNQTAITVVRTGKNQTMRHMQRTHDVCTKWLTNILATLSDRIHLNYCDTKEMCADILTKPFDSAIKFAAAKLLVMCEGFKGERILDWESMRANAKKITQFYRKCFCSTCVKTKI